MGSVCAIRVHLRPVCRLPNPLTTMDATTLTYPDSNMSNFVVAVFGGLPTYFAALVQESPTMMVFGAVLTFAFFLMGKAIDVSIKIYLDRRNEKKRTNGTKDTSNGN